ncbi:MAG TPA: hypothetical protein VK464_13875 [Symbiobacteriaceae bacterium]|nr:hypothetical protein [Symbiobacteriaceae bacterium]
MDEPRWFNSAEEYRTVQVLVREGRYREAVERARLALAEGCLGRKHAARLHSQICWLYAEHLPMNPAAVLHGEEAVRLAGLVSDEWIKTEALARLVHANCRLGDLERAGAALQEVARAVEANDGALVGGLAALRQLEATLAAAAGDEARCLLLLEQAEALAGQYPPAVGARVRLQRVGALLEYGCAAEARRLLRQSPAGVDDDLEWDLARAWLALFEAAPAEANARLCAVAARAGAEGRPAVVAVCLGLRALAAERMQNGEAAAGLAHQALWQSITLGRTDLVRRLRHCLNRLLPA